MWKILAVCTCQRRFPGIRATEAMQWQEFELSGNKILLLILSFDIILLFLSLFLTSIPDHPSSVVIYFPRLPKHKFGITRPRLLLLCCSADGSGFSSPSSSGDAIPVQRRAIGSCFRVQFLLKQRRWSRHSFIHLVLVLVLLVLSPSATTSSASPPADDCPETITIVLTCVLYTCWVP